MDTQNSNVTTGQRAHPLEHRIPPPAAMVLVGALMWAASLAGPTAPLPAPLRLMVGLAIAAAGLALVVGGFRTFRDAGTTIDPVNIGAASTLVTSGPFGRTRNPMYVGFAVALLGWAVSLGSPVGLLGPLAFVAFINRFQIAPEERLMRGKFGDAFERYAARVPRWL